MHSVLITGGAGFIGQNLVHSWSSTRPEDRVVVLDALTYAANIRSLEPLIADGRVSFVKGDIRDAALMQRLFVEHAFTRVLHLAAESHVDRSIVEPEAFLQTNVMGTFALLNAALGNWRARNAMADARFLHISTDEVYGSLSASDPAFTESTAYRPNSPYAASKAGSDHLVRAWHHTHGLPTLTTNCSNNYGPYHFPEKLIPLTIIRALRGESLPVYGKGENVRDWLHVEDHAEALTLVLRKGRPGETYNVGGDSEQRNIDVVHAICGLLDDMLPNSMNRPHAKLIRFVTDRPGHDVRYAIDAGKIERELGWRPRHDFADGLRQTVRWYLDNRGWWERVMSGAYRGERLGLNS